MHLASPRSSWLTLTILVAQSKPDGPDRPITRFQFVVDSFPDNMIYKRATYSVRQIDGRVIIMLQTIYNKQNSIKSGIIYYLTCSKRYASTGCRRQRVASRDCGGDGHPEWVTGTQRRVTIRRFWVVSATRC